MEDIENNLNTPNPNGDEDTLKALEAGLRAMRIQSVVQQGAALRQARRRTIVWLWAALAVLLCCGAGWVYYQWRHTPPVENPTPPPTASETIQLPVPNTPAKPSEPLEKSTPSAPKQQEPIAQLPDLAPPAFAAPRPLVRGQQQADPARQALLDALWYTTYPLRGLSVEGSDYDAVDSLIRERNFTGAYIRLERMARTSAPSDTLRYLRAYCLLETGQGEEALRDLDAIRPVPPAWSTQVAWYRGLAYLLAGSDKAALAAFSAITQQPAHPYFEEARKAVDRID